MGVKPYAIATSVSLIIAQRLARELCTNCKQKIDIPTEALLKEGFSKRPTSQAGMTIFAAEGLQPSAPTGTRAASASTRSCRSPRRSAAS